MNNEYIKYIKNTENFDLLLSVHVDLGVDYKILRERLFLTLFPTTVTPKCIKETQDIFKF